MPCYFQIMLPLFKRSRRGTTKRGRLISSCWILTASLASAETTAADARLSLEWTAPPECPTVDQVRADLRSLLVHSRGNSSERVAVTATIRRSEPQGYALELTSLGDTRSIRSDSCVQLAQAAALMMALMLDPGLALEATRNDAIVAPDTPSTPTPRAADSASIPAPSSLPLTHWVGLLDVAARVDVGAWPSWGYGAVLGIGLGLANWRLITRTSLGSPVRLDAGQSARLEFVPVTIGLESGYRFRSGRWSVEPRLGVELGVIRSRASGLATAQRTTLWLATTAMARVNHRVGAGVQVWLGIGSALPVWRPRWLLAGTPLHEMGAALRTELGLESSF